MQEAIEWSWTHFQSAGRPVWKLSAICGSLQRCGRHRFLQKVMATYLMYQLPRIPLTANTSCGWLLRLEGDMQLTVYPFYENGSSLAVWQSCEGLLIIVLPLLFTVCTSPAPSCLYVYFFSFCLYDFLLPLWLFIFLFCLYHYFPPPNVLLLFLRLLTDKKALSAEKELIRNVHVYLWFLSLSSTSIVNCVFISVMLLPRTWWLLDENPQCTYAYTLLKSTLQM